MQNDFAKLRGQKIKAVGIFNEQLLLTEQAKTNFEKLKAAIETPVVETVPFRSIISTYFIGKSPFVHVEANNARGQYEKYELEFSDVTRAEKFNNNLGKQLGYELKSQVDPKAGDIKYRIMKVLLIVLCISALLYMGMPKDSVQGSNGKQELVALFFNKIYENGLSGWVIAALMIYVLGAGYLIYESYRRSGKRKIFVRPSNHPEVFSYD